jgi:hypothetical protein
MDKSNLVGLAEAAAKFDPTGAEQRPATAAEGASPRVPETRPPETRPIEKGRVDPLGDTVSRIHIDTDKFTIYSIDGAEREIRRPRYYLKGDYATAETYRQRLNVVSGTINRINDLIVGMRPDRVTSSFYSKQYDSLVERAREHQAQAMQQGFEGHGEDALQMLAEFREEIEHCRDSRNKMRYILANAVSVIILIGLWSVFRHFDQRLGFVGALLASPIPIDAPNAQATLRLVDMLALGAIGAFFSVSVGINELKIDNAITLPEMIYAGCIRILIGVIGAGVVFLLILGGWMLTAIDAKYQLWSYALFAFIAGFSELLVPNALKRAEASASDKVPATPAAKPAAIPPPAGKADDRPPPPEP